MREVCRIFPAERIFWGNDLRNFVKWIRILEEILTGKRATFAHRPSSDPACVLSVPSGLCQGDFGLSLLNIASRVRSIANAAKKIVLMSLQVPPYVRL
jgi:hypothetical protein